MPDRAMAPVGDSTDSSAGRKSDCSISGGALRFDMECVTLPLVLLVLFELADIIVSSGGNSIDSPTPTEKLDTK